MNELVVKLSSVQPVEASRPEKTFQALKESIDRNYVHIKFKNTETEIGMQILNENCSFDKADFNNVAGEIELVGALTLNYVKVKCVANIDISNCEGYANLVPVDDAEYAELLKN
jgi:hypothetical protein